MGIEVISVWAAISFGGAGPPTLDLGGHAVIDAPVVSVTEALAPLGVRSRAGRAFPHLAFVDGGYLTDREAREFIEHELTHLRQYDAIGPGVNLALTLGQGQVFEDYHDLDGRMWDPGHDPDSRRCPIVRIEDHAPRLFPCWNPF